MTQTFKGRVILGGNLWATVMVETRLNSWYTISIPLALAPCTSL
jgi:hypothetical protein